MKFVLFLHFLYYVTVCQGQNGTVYLGPTTPFNPPATTTPTAIRTTTPVTAKKILKIGAMFPRGISALDATISYSRTAGGLTVGMNKILEYNLWKDINFTVVFYFDQCNEALAAGGAVKLIRDDKVDVIIGPACSASVAMAATVAAFYNFPIFAWSTILAADLSDGTKYPTLASTSINSYTLSQALGDLFTYFQWNEFAFFYSIILNNASPRCSYFQADLDKYVATNDITMVYKKQTTTDSYAELRAALRRMKTQARIIVTCYEANTKKREFIAAAMDEGMTTNDYLFIYLQTAQTGFGSTPFWVDTSAKPDGRDEQIKKASKNILILDLEQLPSTFANFNSDVYDAMFEWPINCQESNDCPPVGANMTKQAAYLTDTFFLYASALNKSMTQYPNDPDVIRNGKIINSNIAKTKFAGYSGQVRINENGTREPVYNVLGLDSNGNPQLYFVIERKDNETSNIIPQFKDEKTTLWGHRGGARPLSHPVCDFDGSACPPSILETYLGYIIGGIILGLAFIIILFLAVYYSYRMRIENRRKMDELWQIPFVRLLKPDEKTKHGHSPRSTISSLGSSSARLSASNKEATEHFDFYYFNNELLAAKKHNSRPKLTEKDNILFRTMQQTNHDNLCRFIGLSMDGPLFLSLWKYCSRGCLRDVIAHSNVQMDGFFMTSLINDIVEGISFLHNSPMFEYHGDISSKTCLVDERWQVKITLYGLFPFKFFEKRDNESLLWCAPEILRSDEEFYGSAASDIYSFAITASEILTQKPVWGIGENGELDAEEIGKPLCRYCRLKKCYDVGMKSDELPKIKSASKLKLQEKVNNHPRPSDEVPLKSTTINVERVYHEVQRILEQESQPYTALDNLKSTKKFAEVLSKQLTKPKKLLHLMDSEKKETRGQYYEKFLIDVAQLLLNIEYYSSLSFSQKFPLYKRFWQMFQLILNCYRAFISYGNDLTDTRYPIDNDHFIDIDNTIKQDHNEATLFLLPIFLKSKMLLLSLKKTSPTIFEFAYICQLMLWSCAEIEELTRETCQLAEDMIQKASDELHDYYVHEMHMLNYAARQAELIKLVRLTDFVFRDKKQLMAANQVFNFMENNLKLSVLT